MDKNTELRSSILYFVDEAIGFRKSIHHFHRWLEFAEREELSRLVIEVGDEQFVDLRALVSSVKIKNDSRIEAAIDTIKSYGFFKTTNDFKKIPLVLEIISKIVLKFRSKISPGTSHSTPNQKHR